MALLAAALHTPPALARALARLSTLPAADGQVCGVHAVYWGSEEDAKKELKDVSFVMEAPEAIDAEVKYTVDTYEDHIRLWTLYSCARFRHCLLAWLRLPRRLAPRAWQRWRCLCGSSVWIAHRCRCSPRLPAAGRPADTPWTMEDAFVHGTPFQSDPNTGTSRFRPWAGMDEIQAFRGAGYMLEEPIGADAIPAVAAHIAEHVWDLKAMGNGFSIYGGVLGEGDGVWEKKGGDGRAAGTRPGLRGAGVRAQPLHLAMHHHHLRPSSAATTYGGAISDLPNSATGYGHRQHIQNFAVSVTPLRAADNGTADGEWLSELGRLLLPYSKGALWYNYMQVRRTRTLCGCLSTASPSRHVGAQGRGQGEGGGG